MGEKNKPHTAVLREKFSEDSVDYHADPADCVNNTHHYSYGDLKGTVVANHTMTALTTTDTMDDGSAFLVGLR